MGEITDLVFTVLGKFGRILNVRGKDFVSSFGQHVSLTGVLGTINLA